MPLVKPESTDYSLSQAVSVSNTRRFFRSAAAFRCFGHKKLPPTIQSLQLETETRSLMRSPKRRVSRDLEISTEPLESFGLWTSLIYLDISWYTVVNCSWLLICSASIMCKRCELLYVTVVEVRDRRTWLRVCEIKVVYPLCDPTLSATRRHFVDLLERPHGCFVFASASSAGSSDQSMNYSIRSESVGMARLNWSSTSWKPRRCPMRRQKPPETQIALWCLCDQLSPSFEGDTDFTCYDDWLKASATQ